MGTVGPDPASRKRTLKPRAPVAAAPSFVSQLTCLVLLGIDPRRFLDVLVPACRPNVARVGKLRLVELSRAVEALRAMASEADDAPAEVDEPDGEAQPETANEVLARLSTPKELAS